MMEHQTQSLLIEKRELTARIAELEAERDRLQDVLFERVTVLNELDAKIEPLLRDNARLRTFLVDDAATEGQWAKLKRENALLLRALERAVPFVEDANHYNVSDLAGNEDTKGGVLSCIRAALARIPEAKPPHE